MYLSAHMVICSGRFVTARNGFPPNRGVEFYFLLPISSRQIAESISIAAKLLTSRFLFSVADFFPPNRRVDFYCVHFFPPNRRVDFYCRFFPAKIEESISIADFFPPSSDPSIRHSRYFYPPLLAAAPRSLSPLALPPLPSLLPISDRTSSVHHPGHNNIIGRTLIY